MDKSNLIEQDNFFYWTDGQLPSNFNILKERFTIISLMFILNLKKLCMDSVIPLNYP
jgi:hypothetical protein